MNEGQAEHAEAGLRHRAKRALRNQMRTVRGALPESACEARSKAILQRIAALPELEEATTILSFASIRNEVRTQPFMESAWAAGKRVILPRVIGEELCLHVVAPNTALADGAYSVPEPPAHADTIEPAEVDFALVPALAVDPRGFRIGYGGGYYDKLLPRLANACTCALAYDFQLISEVPELPFDAAVDIVATDERLIRVR